MIRNFKIANFKSIVSADMPIGRFTVLIGENGAGKSNILEALVMASAASKGNLDREVLIGRGMRVPTPELMQTAFTIGKKRRLIELALRVETPSKSTRDFDFSLEHDGSPYGTWKLINPRKNMGNDFVAELEALAAKTLTSLPESHRKVELDFTIKLVNALKQKRPVNLNVVVGEPTKEAPGLLIAELAGSSLAHRIISNFTLYSPDYYTLRNFVAEGQTAPLGTRGEGLLKLLAVMQSREPDRLAAVDDGLRILGWYKALDLKSLAQNASENRIQVKDRFIKQRGVVLDQLSTNEGFLFCLFYLVLFASSITPKAFAIENIENGLNPKLCEALVLKLKSFGEKYGKQAIISTHSPSVLDALNLDSPEEKLIAVDRNLDGHTRINVIKKPRTVGGKPKRLSELFLQGHLGGVPRNFI